MGKVFLFHIISFQLLQILLVYPAYGTCERRPVAQRGIRLQSGPNYAEMHESVAEDSLYRGITNNKVLFDGKRAP